MLRRAWVQAACFTVFAGALCFTCAGAQENDEIISPKSPRVFPQPGHLPALARALIKDRMRLHGDDLSDLMWSVLFLDFESTQAIAEDIAQAPRLSRPFPQEEDILNRALSPAFFELQDELIVGARKLASAAREQREDDVALEYGRLSAVCVRCHIEYLREPVDAPSPPIEPGELGGN